MDRRLQHTVHVPLGFAETCARIEERSQELLDRATAVAAMTVRRRTPSPVASTVQGPVWVAAHPLVHDAEYQATMALEWHASSPSGRLLPHIDARLVVNGVIVKGAHASTAVSMLGTFDPSSGLLRRIDDRLFRRRLVDEVTGAFLDALVIGLLDQPIDLRSEGATVGR